MEIRLALVGNPNCGKTTLFNSLTGENEPVGNRSGVTVEIKQAEVKAEGEDSFVLLDLPGIYSLYPYSPEETLSCEYLFDKRADLIINVVSCVNIERSLYLTLQLSETQVPMIIALNMVEEGEKRDIHIDEKKLSKILKKPVIKLCEGDKGIILNKLNEIVSDNSFELLNKPVIFSRKVLFSAQKLNGKLGGRLSVFQTIALLEGEECFKENNFSENERSIIKKEREELFGLKNECRTDMLIASLRYSFIEGVISKSVKKGENKIQSVTEKVDSVVLNKYFAYPIFLLLAVFIFYVVFGNFGSYLSSLTETAIKEFFINPVVGAAMLLGLRGAALSLISDGIGSGICSVLKFLPQLMLIFAFIFVLEETGYMARTSFIMDKPLRKFGFGAKAFIPLMLGFGCSVPAIMAARTIENERQRRSLIILAPFISCGARMPVYLLFTEVFFKENKWLVVLSLYGISVTAVFISGFIIKRLLNKQEDYFIMEPAGYRMPKISSVLENAAQRASEFIKKAFTTVTLVSAVIWLFQSFDKRLNYIGLSSKETSLLEIFAGIIYPVFKPLGIKDSRVCAALVTGFGAKENIVSTFGVLYSKYTSVEEGLRLAFKQKGCAYAFLVFVLLYTPCAAAISVMARELKSVTWTVIAVFYQLTAAWVGAFIVYRIWEFLF